MLKKKLKKNATRNGNFPPRGTGLKLAQFRGKTAELATMIIFKYATGTFR